MTYLDRLATYSDRCSHGYAAVHHPDLCSCAGIAAGRAGMAAAEAAHPDDAARVDDAIRKLASTGVPFSANQARTIHGVKGGVVGARFAAAQTAGLIEPVGSEASTDKGTHGKALTRWIGRRAA